MTWSTPTQVCVLLKKTLHLPWIATKTRRLFAKQLAAALRELDELRRHNQDRERELEAENNSYKIEITKLRAELDAILKELENIIDTKLGLELEIAAYRKLLEGEENRSVQEVTLS